LASSLAYVKSNTVTRQPSAKKSIKRLFNIVDLVTWQNRQKQEVKERNEQGKEARHNTTKKVGARKNARPRGGQAALC
jgi:hypothetical protein